MDSFEKNIESFKTFIRDGNGRVEERVDKLEVNIMNYKTLVASSFLPTSPELRKMKRIIDVQNRNDEMCSLLSVFAGVHPIANHSQHVSYYREYESQLRMNIITYRIDKFGELILNICDNVFAYEEQLYPLRFTNHQGREHYFNLFLCGPIISTHYCPIKNLSRVLSFFNIT